MLAEGVEKASTCFGKKRPSFLNCFTMRMHDNMKENRLQIAPLPSFFQAVFLGGEGLRIKTPAGNSSRSTVSPLVL